MIDLIYVTTECKLCALIEKSLSNAVKKYLINYFSIKNEDILVKEIYNCNKNFLSFEFKHDENNLPDNVLVIEYDVSNFIF